MFAQSAGSTEGMICTGRGSPASIFAEPARFADVVLCAAEAET
jgi:hypothetical protein